MKTAEEIHDDHYTAWGYSNDPLKNHMVKAMQDFAAQSVREYKEKLKEEGKKTIEKTFHAAEAMKLLEQFNKLIESTH